MAKREQRQDAGLPDAVEGGLDQLYRRPPGEFVAGRDALVKSLRSAGQREAAERVKGLRRPSVAAWLVNRLSLDQPKQIGRFAESVRRLGDAQSEALSGGSAEGLRRAAAEERKQIGRLVEAARRLGEELERRPGERVYEQVAETLRAAGTDPELTEQVGRGRVARDHAAATLGAMPTGPVRAARATRSSSADPEAKRAKRALERLRGEAERAEERVVEAKAGVERAEREVREAKATLAEERRAAREAQKRLRAAER